MLCARRQQPCAAKKPNQVTHENLHILSLEVHAFKAIKGVHWDQIVKAEIGIPQAIPESTIDDKGLLAKLSNRFGVDLFVDEEDARRANEEVGVDARVVTQPDSVVGREVDVVFVEIVNDSTDCK